MERARVLEGEGRGIREGGNGEKVPQLLAMFDLLLAFLFAIQLSKLLRFFLMWILKSHVFYKTSTTFFLFFEKKHDSGFSIVKTSSHHKQLKLFGIIVF
jgi:hypothetical protein